jgi:4-diphosphocytidyl-2-C-methyl-D-erythritol kinase
VAARLAAQAKVNLALRVGARSPDGYHDLATIFARVELADDVVVRPRRRGVALKVTREGMPDESLGPADRNLAVRAAQAYMREAAWPPGCAIDIEKRIPVGGGLGGGSADAGAVLRGLDALAPRPLGSAALMRIASTIGADVPFLASTAPLALGTGRGDRIVPLETLPQRWLALVVPAFGVSTAEAYGWFDANRAPDATGIREGDVEELRHAAKGWDSLVPSARNDLQSSVAARHPVIDTYCAALRRAGALLAMMSGSGSAVFGLFRDEPDVAALTRACDASVLVTRVPARVVGPLGSE